MGALVRLGLVAHGGYGGLVVELAVVVGLAALVVAVVVQGRRARAREREEAAAPPLREETLDADD